MRTLICLVLAASLSGCLPIGIRGSSAPLRGAGIGERPTVAVIDGRLAGRMNSALRNPSPDFVGANLFARIVACHAVAELIRP